MLPSAPRPSLVASCLRLRQATRLPWLSRCFYTTQAKSSDPLRILFCGSDEFSCASLKALHEEHKRNQALIRSIDVVVRPGKPTGRGNKVLRTVPLQSLAQQLQLPIHQRDTFTGWDMPRLAGEPINLIIAVSFGLFVPPRLLRAAKYGGLNVHPSLLPDLRGPAPLHHALLLGRTHTGTSLQTLSEHTFDAGTVLSQTALPGIPIPQDCDFPTLLALLTPPSAAILVDGLRANLHVPPHIHRGWTPTPSEHQLLAHAPKATTEDKRIRWATASADSVVRQARVLGPPWMHAAPLGSPERIKRLIFEDISLAEGEPPSQSQNILLAFTDEAPCLGEEQTILVRLWKDDEDGESIILKMPSGGYLRVKKIKEAGLASRSAQAVILGFLA